MGSAHRAHLLRKSHRHPELRRIPLADSTSWHPKRVVILEFPTIEQMNAFRNSDEYNPVEELRHKAADTEGFTVVGYDG
ncbi:MAG: DUF1330 domain-containing protein [Acidobacteriota bacterium]